MANEVSGGLQVILPVWHQMTEADVMSYSLTLAGKLARGTAEYSVEQIATEITEVARV